MTTIFRVYLHLPEATLLKSIPFSNFPGQDRWMDRQEALCSDEGMLKFLVAAYLTKPRLPPRDGYEEPMAVAEGGTMWQTAER